MAFIKCGIIMQARAIALQCFCSAGVDFNGGTILYIALSQRDFTSKIVYTASNLQIVVHCFVNTVSIQY